MAGTTLDRKLTAAEKTRYALAEPRDDAAIRRLLRDNPMPGDISVGFERDPSYFRGADIGGGEEEAIVARSGNQLQCIGRCTRRDLWVNGEPRRTGYLAELRLDSGARGHGNILRAGYKFFRQLAQADDAGLYFTSIATDNLRARRMLENGNCALPTYSFLQELTTILIAVPRSRRREKLRIEAATPRNLDRILALLNDHGRRHQLATCWTAERLLALSHHNLPLERFYLGFEGERLVACGGLWDQRGFRQTVIRGYSRALSLARPLWNVGALCLGAPLLPRLGSVLAQAFVSPLAWLDDAVDAVPSFVAALAPPAAELGLSYLTLAIPSAHPLVALIRRRFSTRIWRSRLYRVHWPGDREISFDDRPFLPEVALL